MKRKILGFILSILLLFLVGCQETVTNNIEAEVLSINSHILNGQLLGAFLGSSSGSFTNDVIKIGVKFEIGRYLFLEDLKLQHAELAYYKNKNTIPLSIQCRSGYCNNYSSEFKTSGTELARHAKDVPEDNLKKGKAGTRIAKKIRRDYIRIYLNGLCKKVVRIDVSMSEDINNIFSRK